MDVYGIVFFHHMSENHVVNIGKPMFGTLQSNEGWSIPLISEMSLDEKPCD